MQSVILTELGIAIFDAERCIKTFPFSEPTRAYMEIKQRAAHLDELIAYVSSLDTGVQVNDASLLELLQSNSIETYLADEQTILKTQSDKLDILVNAKFATSHDDATSKLREFAIELSSAKVTEESQSPDMHIIQAIRTMDEIDKTINAYNSRLREWYGLHFPELENIIDSIASYANIAITGRRSAISSELLSSFGLDTSSTEMVSLLASKSRGGDITDENLSMVHTIADHIIQMTKHRRELEDHITSEMKNIAPNTSVILGALIGARIISRAGSLERLAQMPASSIQVIGAEKALFRALKTGARPPKHGLLFQHQLVHAAPRWQRGKMARAIASKAAIAARVDMYGEGLNETLLEKLNVRVNEIGTETEPPKRSPLPQRQRQDQRDPSRHDRRGNKKSHQRRFDKRSRKVRAN